MPAPTSKMRLPGNSSVDRAVLSTPPLAVSWMVGKKAARAARTLALAPISCASAEATSGRRTSRPEGRPVVTGGAATCFERALIQLQLVRVRAHQNGQRRQVVRKLCAQGRDGGVLTVHQ